jgi:hypothetical protein
MQRAIVELLELGTLPSESTATEEQVGRAQSLIEEIEPPLSHDEARALLLVFGEDDCFGLAWAILHLIESTPGWPLHDALSGATNAWIVMLRDRASRAPL